MNFEVAFREGMCHVPEMLSLITDMPGTYSSQGLRSQRQHAVINAVFDRLASPQYADVAPSFERSGVLNVLGPSVIVAAAGRTDAWSKSTLSLLNGFTAEQYETLLEHSESAVRELAGFFLGPFWREAKVRRQRESDERGRLHQALTAHESQLAQTQQSLAKSEEALARLRKHRSEAELLLARANQILADREARLSYVEGAAGRLSETISRMESSYFWKLRRMLAHCKHALLRPFGRDLAGPASHG